MTMPMVVGAALALGAALFAALSGSRLFDYFRSDLIANPGVPGGWPMFCGTFDVVAGACLGLILVRRKHAASPGGPG